MNILYAASIRETARNAHGFLERRRSGMEMDMRRYFAYTKQAFLANSAFRFDHVMGIVDACLNVFIFWCIYRALYGGREQVDGITLAMVTTNFILSIGLSAAFSLDEGYLPYRIQTGSIATELLKPIRFRGILLATDLGSVCFAVLFRFVPAVLVAIPLVGMEKPCSLPCFLAFLVSVCLGFLVLWTLNFIFQALSFWLINTWSLRTIKNVFVNLLSGSMIPLWFMPDWMQGVIRFTPFSSIYFEPVKIYLGQLTGMGIGLSFLRQACWIVVLAAVGEWIWRRGIRKLVIQGG